MGRLVHTAVNRFNSIILGPFYSGHNRVSSDVNHSPKSVVVVGLEWVQRMGVGLEVDLSGHFLEVAILKSIRWLFAQDKYGDYGGGDRVRCSGDLGLEGLVCRLG